ncbi:MAG: peptidase domain protein [Limisphaerales bacterium]|nr:MAG: peptidase domain protein [Limisphaerales bacterium]KAG0507975.1 MAG: peptidase domain protein [Limisphaerales bacterium]TXT48081.1 MAG: peptidase domain protein [Limisphaerales bacterium]
MQPNRRTVRWLLLAAALVTVWSFRLRNASQIPPASPPPAPPPLVSLAARATSPPASAEAAWNGWRAQLPVTKPALEDVTEWPANRAEPFEKFREWQGQYRAAADKAAREAEGVALAKSRRAAMARWIERDPEFALAQAVGPDARRDLPPAVLAELERWVEGKGGLEVMIRCGPEVKAAEQMTRTVRVNGEEFKAFVYGRRLGQTTRYDLPVHAVALDGRLALHSSPVRQLEPGEARERGLNPQGIHLETGGEVASAASAVDAFAIEARLLQREAGRGPYPAGQTASGQAPAGLPPGTAPFPPSPGWAFGVKRFLIVRVDFSDDPGGPFDRNTGQTITTNMMNTVMATVNQFYLDNSQGQTSIQTFHLPAVLRMPQTKATYDAGTPADLQTDMQTAALQYDQANGNTGQFNPANYDLDTVVFSVMTGGNWQFGGLAGVGAKRMWINGEFTLRLLAHELGHNYGLWHANRWDVTGTDPLDPAGTHLEYGDDYDMMGGNNGSGGNRPIHFNEWFKSYLGWLNTNQWRTAPTGGVYRLMRHDHTNASGLRGITVGQTNDRSYWLGFRHDLTNYAKNSFGATNFLANGVEIRWGMQAPGLASDMAGEGSRLLNFTPATADFTRHPLPVGQTFTDTNFSLSITPLGVGGTAPNEFIDVNVSYSIAPVTITQNPTNVTVPEGGSASFAVTVTGAGPITYQWAFNSVNIPGATSSNLSLTGVTTNQTGTYLVRVTNPGGTVNSQPATLTVVPVPINLLSNGGFEFPVLSSATVVNAGGTNILGWSVAGSSPMFFLNGPSQGVTAHDGAQMVSFNISDSPPGNTLAQTFVTTQGQAYSVTYYVSRGGGGLGTVRLRAAVTSGTGATLAMTDSTAPATVGWSPVQTLFFVATTTTSTLTFLDNSLVTTSVDAFLDDVTVAPAPPGVPIITVPPQDLTVQAGTSATLTVSATGTPPPAYQWLFNGTNLPGATSSDLTLANVQPANAGTYSVRVSNANGSTVSPSATLSVITFAPVAHWKFDEVPGSTVAVDSQGNFNGTNSPTGAAFVGGGRSGNALSLDLAANGLVNMGDNLMLGATDFTVSAWIKTPPGDTTGFANFLSKHVSGTGNGYILGYNHTAIPNGANHAFFYAGTRTIFAGGFTIVDVPVSTSSVNDGTWHQIVGVYQASGNTTVYVDGAPLEGSILSSPIAANTASFLIGGVTVGTTPTGNYSGLVDDVQIYNRALADAEIDFLFQNPGQPVVGAPIVTVLAQNTNAVVVGQTATFGVTNLGIAPFTYQWRFNGTNLPGATSPTLTLNNVQTNQGGSYSVRIDNALGFTTSTNVSLTVLVPAFVIAQPTNVTVLAGGSATFAVTPGGTPPFSYQWRFNGTNLPAANSSTLTVPNAQFASAGDYSVLVVNPYGSTVSSNAVLTVNSPPIITAQPAGRVASVAAPAAFTVGVAGTPPFTYQWRFNGSNLAGANAASHVISGVVPGHAGLYSVAVTNAYGFAISASAPLTVLPVRVFSPWGAVAGGAGSDGANAVAVDTNGNAFVAGHFTGTALFGTNQLVSAGVRDGFLAKYSAAGQLLWVRGFGGPGFDVVNAVAVDTNGNAYVVGNFEGTASFGSAVLNNTSASSFSDVFIAKFDAGGTNVWARGLGIAASSDLGNAVALDGAGNVLVAGQSTFPSFSGVALTNHGRIFVAKYDNAGNPLWARKAGGGSAGQFDSATAVAADAAGNVYLAGVFATATANFDGGLALGNEGGFDAFLARFDSTGGLQWVRQLGGAQDARANGVAVDAAGNAYVAGEFTGALQLPGTNLSTTVSDQNLFVARFSPAGGVDWARQAGGALQDSARAVTVRGTNVFLAGYFSGVATIGPDTLSSVGNTFDAFLARLDTNGNFAFAQQAGGGDLGGDFGLGVAVDANGSALLVGYFSGAGALGGTTAGSAGGEDIFVARFNAFAGDAAPTLGFLPLSGQLRLSWPLGSSSYILQGAPDLRPQSWVDLVGVLGVENSELAMTNQVPVTNRFFRLRKP